MRPNELFTNGSQRNLCPGRTPRTPNNLDYQKSQLASDPCIGLVADRVLFSTDFCFITDPSPTKINPSPRRHSMGAGPIE